MWKSKRETSSEKQSNIVHEYAKERAKEQVRTLPALSVVEHFTGVYVRPPSVAEPTMGNQDPEEGSHDVETSPDASDCVVFHVGVALGEPSAVGTVKTLSVPDQAVVVPGQVITGAAASVMLMVNVHEFDRSALSKVMHCT
jgi:hypothetical protein